MSDIKDLLFNQDPEIVNTGLDQLTFFFEEELAREILGETTYQFNNGEVQFQFADPMWQVPAESRIKVALFLLANLEDEAFHQHTDIVLDEWILNPCPSFSMPHLTSLTWRVNMSNGELATTEDLIWDLDSLEKIEIRETNLDANYKLKNNHFVGTSISGGLSRIPYIDAL